VHRLSSVGTLFVAHLWLGLYRNPDEWPWTYVFLIFVQSFFLFGDGGKSLGLDALLTARPAGPFAGDGIMARLYRRIA
jgi:hypothetical protein